MTLLVLVEQRVSHSLESEAVKLSHIRSNFQVESGQNTGHVRTKEIRGVAPCFLRSDQCHQFKVRKSFEQQKEDH